ncbi:MAG: hypothetical protein B7C24_06825 [Bacteroidetes bacterium 4572_77]|nr:MAG: hypothetical protein B7C24_06825 [Bacteroidetes bacterium 4572_77]
MRAINIRDISEIMKYDHEFFDKVGSLTAIRQRNTGEFYRANYERGLFLYYLVMKNDFITKAVELGTGRGYGSICICKAWDDKNEKWGYLDTIDVVPHNKPQPWLTKYGMQTMTLKQLMEKAYPGCTKRIRFETGKTTMLKDKYLHESGFPAQLAYIDAGHTYEEVKGDWKHIHNVATDDAIYVFDDYKQNEFGVKKLIDKIKGYNKLLIYMDRQIFPEDRKNAKVDYGQVIVTKRKIKDIL